MNIPKNPPPWDINDQDRSFEGYAAWLNQIARASFLHDGHHPQMFFFITEEGHISGCQFRDGLEKEKIDAVIFKEAERIKPFGTVQILIKKIYDPKVCGNPKFKDTKFSGALDSEPEVPERDGLLVVMKSRTGNEKIWASPIIKTADKLTLMDSIETFPVKQSE